MATKAKVINWLCYHHLFQWILITSTEFKLIFHAIVNRAMYSWKALDKAVFQLLDVLPQCWKYLKACGDTRIKSLESQCTWKHNLQSQYSQNDDH